MREAHVPAEQPKAQEAPRLPVPYAKPGRSGGAQGPTPARPYAPVGLIWRVRDRATFAVLARAERHARGPVTIRFVPGESEAPPRVAYAVGGVGNAVVRNRLRRRLRAAVAGAAARPRPRGGGRGPAPPGGGAAPPPGPPPAGGPPLSSRPGR